MMDYFNDMTYVGAFAKDDVCVSSTVGSVQSGMLVELQVKVDAGQVRDVRYKVYGNQYAIASMAFVAHWMIGKTSDDINVFDYRLLVNALSIPVINVYCAVLVQDALQCLSL